MHPNDDAIHAYVDGSLGAAECAEIDRHVASCASCRQLLEDLREILRATKALELREPPVRVWSRIERAIELERDHGDPGARRLQPSGTASEPGPARAGRYRWAKWLAAAAAVVLATVVGLRFMPSGREQVRTDAPATVGAGQAAASVEAELQQAEAHYVNAIRGLEQIASAEQNALDPRTAATLRTSLAVIDQAITESRAAVRSEPTNGPAQQSLLENFKSKIALLQDTVALINEMRKGNEAGAARIVSGLKQKGN
jgi:negative regulator of sigma E activity